MEDSIYNYEVSVIWKNDRNGILYSSDLDQQIEIATPPEFPKGEEGIWSPEHLFTAAVNSCMMTTFLAIAEYSKLEFSDFNSNAVGVLEKVDGKFMMSKIRLHSTVLIDKEADIEKAERILKKSKAACLISNSIKSEIIFKPEVIVKVTS